MTTWRYIAQRALTGEFLDWDLPLERDELTWVLSGAGSLRGTVAPEVGRLVAADGRPILDEWGTLLYAEADGRLRWGGILVSSTFEGAAWRLEAASFGSYLYGLPFMGEVASTSIDPLDVVRAIWTHAQSYPGGNLGMVVEPTTTPVRLGKPAVTTTTTDPTTKKKVTRIVEEAEPYVLAWWEAKDCGQEVVALARETPFDFEERHAWADDSSTISHTLRLGYPRLGTRRPDLAFVEGENVSDVVKATRHGDAFANTVVGLGAGEGRKTLRHVSAERDDRLRRVAVWTDKGASRTAALSTATRAELARRRQLLDVRSFEVRDHAHARLASWQLGDDVRLQFHAPWLGDVSLWVRVLAWSLVTEDRAVLTVARSDFFDYSGGSQ